jgi:orotate phosphoribosyltransferase
MTTNEQQLLELLKERSFRLGTFKLASGDTSNYYIDGRMTEVFSKGAHLIGEVIYERTRDLGIDGIGGLAVGAVPLTTAAVISYHLHGQTMEGFLKEHGTQQQIEGNLKAGARVVIVEDVVTRGTSALKALDAVRAIGGEVAAVLTLVDRLCGAAELFRERGVAEYRPIFTIRDLGVPDDSGVTG